MSRTSSFSFDPSDIVVRSLSLSCLSEYGAFLDELEEEKWQDDRSRCTSPASFTSAITTVSVETAVSADTTLAESVASNLPHSVYTCPSAVDVENNFLGRRWHSTSTMEMGIIQRKKEANQIPSRATSLIVARPSPSTISSQYSYVSNFKLSDPNSVFLSMVSNITPPDDVYPCTIRKIMTARHREQKLYLRRQRVRRFFSRLCCCFKSSRTDE
uniref:Developmental regulator n=1 Tax=Panagrellus redivivus TaxID=6233 RepID=A0A7E4W490_PANRE